MQNIELKKQLLSDGTYKQYVCERREGLKQGFNVSHFIEDNDGKIVVNTEIYKEDIITLKACEQLRNARAHQTKLIEKHIKFFSSVKNSYTFFATFTFKDAALKMKADTRRKKLVRLLSNNFDDFILNIDYGSQNDREHYHAILFVDSKVPELYFDSSKHLKMREIDEYNDGFYGVECVDFNNSDEAKLSRYVSKLTLHSIKVKQTYVSTKRGSRYTIYKKLEEELENILDIIEEKGQRTEYMRRANIVSSHKIALLSNDIPLSDIEEIFSDAKQL